MIQNFKSIVTETVLEEEIGAEEGLRQVVERTAEGKMITFAEMEAFYKKPGGTLTEMIFGNDPFDYWFGRFYVGTFGVISIFGILFGTFFYLYQAWVVEGSYNLLAARIDPPPISVGLRIAEPGSSGFNWQMIVFGATIAFLGWTLRQVDISRKLEMSYEIPFAYFAVVSSWITLQWLRPIAMGAWGNGFALGITHHLDWVSNIGYQYYNFFFNPFHMIGVSLLFFSTLLLAMHGSAILSAVMRPNISEHNVDGFWRNLLGYSIGEIGIHRAGLWVAMTSVLFANLCIFLSGTLVFSWTGFWRFWEALPFWSGAALLGAGGGGIATFIMWRGRKYKTVDPHEYEYGATGLRGTTIKKPITSKPLYQMFGLGQVGPVYLGYAGTFALVSGGAAVLIILQHWLHIVDYNPIIFTRKFFALQMLPPNPEYGLGMAPWHEGGGWIIANFLTIIAVIAWWVRVYTRAKKAGLSTALAWAFAWAIFLYLVIYLFRPLVIGNWTQAPARGFRALLEWTNNVSIFYGNFYYNPFHMISIFFLLGSTLLLAMHGATIVATSKWGSHRELEEMMAEGSGTHRAQLFWRWTMGFNVNSKTIHDWAWYFAIMVMVAGGIGLFMSGTIVYDWFEWAQGVGIVAPIP
ncbi:MAG: bifunctional photosynthetic reaction center subunit L/M [Chloroflexota bacterium]